MPLRKMSEEPLALGGNIELSGFHGMDAGSMVIIKKMVGNYAKKLSDRVDNFEKLKITMKSVHEREKSEKYEIHAQLFAGGKPFVSEDTDRNLFFVLDNVLKRIEDISAK